VDLSEILGEAWNFTVKLTHDIGNLIILFVLNLIPIVNLTFVGYCARIIRLGGSVDRPPRIDRYLEAFIDGLKIFLAVILYALIPLLIVVAAAAPVIMHLGFPMWQAFWWYHARVFFIGAMLFGSILASLIGLFLFIFGAMGIVHMIKTGKFLKAFAVTEILSLISEVGWARYLGWLIIMYILSRVVVSLNSIHWIVFSIVSVFYAVFVARSAHYIYPSKP